MAGFQILDERTSTDLLISRLPESLQKEYDKYGHRKAETVFLERIFYVYRATGQSAGVNNDPAVIARIRVINFRYSVETGFLVDLSNDTTHEKQTVTVNPSKLFTYPIFVHVPCSFTIRHNAVLDPRGSLKNFDASAILYVKTRNKADFCSKGNIYLETPRRMQELFPGFTPGNL